MQEKTLLDGAACVFTWTSRKAVASFRTDARLHSELPAKTARRRPAIAITQTLRYWIPDENTRCGFDILLHSNATKVMLTPICANVFGDKRTRQRT